MSALEELLRRTQQKKLFVRYLNLYDHAKPFGPENIGVYWWQQEFHNAGANNTERCLMAANRVGKTESAAAETAIHLTGKYPPWWEGKRFEAAVRWWTGAERTEDSKDVIQTALLGSEGEHGTGWIPKRDLIRVTYRQAGVSEVVDKIYVQHKSGGVSECTMKTYQMEAKGWRGKSLHGVWLDEECKPDIYSEAVTRILDTRGILLMTVTPVLGATDIMRHFLEGGKGIYYKNVTWDDAPHLDKEEKERLWASYQPWERDTRSRGLPMLGTGAVFPISDDTISVDPFPIPPWYYRINGVDFGIDHPAAGAFCAIDLDADTFYVYDCYKASNETPIYHAAALKKHGDWIPHAWPHDGATRDKESLMPVKDLYRKHGLYMLREHAHYPDWRGNDREPGLIEMYEWMRTGRFKVFSNLNQWFEEKRLYHRKDQKVVAIHDDILSATRMAFIMRRYAKREPSTTPMKKAPSRPIVGGPR